MADNIEIRPIEELDHIDILTDDTFINVVQLRQETHEDTQVDVGYDLCATLADLDSYERQKTIEPLREQLTEKIETAESELSEKIENTNSELSEKIETAESELSEKIESAQTELTEKIESAQTELTEKIEETQADLQKNLDAATDTIAKLQAELAEARQELAEQIAAGTGGVDAAAVEKIIQEYIQKPEAKKAPLTFTAIENATIALNKNGSPANLTLQYSTNDGATWAGYTIGSQIKLNAGQTLQLRNTGDQSTVARTSSNYYKFAITGKTAASGNIMSLLSVNYQKLLSVPACAFYNLFYGCTSLAAAPDLPATTLSTCCYYYMFCGCTSLAAAPDLPATTLADSCYYYMFCGCTSLAAAPDLPATTLADRCYYYMFYGCTSLTAAPDLPATTLADSCYNGMFQGCTSLTAAPDLPATTLSTCCYYYMFCGCTSLAAAPDLPATTLADYCYSYMFYGCTSLKVAAQAKDGGQKFLAMPVGAPSNAGSSMFQNTGGEFTGNPTAGGTYYYY